MMKFIGIIPARYVSSRFPGKPLCDICGKTMIRRVYESVTKWDHWKEVYVATDSSMIADSCKNDNIPYIMTGDYHLDCLDRASETVEILESNNAGADKYIIIQGDEPLFNVDTLNVDMNSSIINFYTEVHDKEELYDPNAVKVVVSKNQKALYFSRYSIPYCNDKTKRDDVNVAVYKQIGVYVFTGETLCLYSNLEPTYLEKTEGIGLNRLLENDICIDMRYTQYDSISIDTPQDQKRIIEMIERKNEK